MILEQTITPASSDTVEEGNSPLVLIGEKKLIPPSSQTHRLFVLESGGEAHLMKTAGTFKNILEVAIAVIVPPVLVLSIFGQARDWVNAVSGREVSGLLTISLVAALLAIIAIVRSIPTSNFLKKSLKKKGLLVCEIEVLEGMRYWDYPEFFTSFHRELLSHVKRTPGEGLEAEVALQLIDAEVRESRRLKEKQFQDEVNIRVKSVEEESRRRRNGGEVETNTDGIPIVPLSAPKRAKGGRRRAATH